MSSWRPRRGGATGVLLVVSIGNKGVYDVGVYRYCLPSFPAKHQSGVAGRRAMGGMFKSGSGFADSTSSILQKLSSRVLKCEGPA